VSLVTSPASFTPGAETIEFKIEVELPKELAGEVLLEVSSLITSPSMRSMRFLVTRQPVTPAISAPPGEPAVEKPRVGVTLTWDGLDQSRRLVEGGRYHYEVRAKLLAVGENGPRTHMNAWPRRGVLIVKEP
jgi:hypothetical protein